MSVIEKPPGTPDITQPKRVFVKTYGCQMNVYDSERITEALGADGYQPTATMDDADVVVLNTCHIREKAAEKVYSDLGRIRVIKETRRQAGKDTLITVAGCVAQAEGQEIVRREPAVDLVIGPQGTHRLAGLVREIQARELSMWPSRAARSSRRNSPRKTNSPIFRSARRIAPLPRS